MVFINSSRRQFLRSSIGGATAIGIGSHIPACFTHGAENSERARENILVVVQMSGGNDGLNTLIPFADPDYKAARPKLGFSADEVLKCTDSLGFHPSMSGLHELLESGSLAVLQGVGYDDPNRSHFESMDIWHTCKRKQESRPDGWLGRYLDTQAEGSGGDVLALHLGQEQQPFAVNSQSVRVPTVRELTEFQLRGQHREQLRELLSSSADEKQVVAQQSSTPLSMKDSPSDNDLLAFLESSTTAALAASERVSEAVQGYKSDITYPTSELGQKLRIVAQLIDAGLTTKIYYVQLDGFDTHSQQAQTHSILLKQWSEAVTALMQDLKSHDHDQRVCVMSFSEFGRRVAENASEGTDHGAAGPMFVCGGKVVAGVVGESPSLTDLQDGDLKHHTDFRQVYATVLHDWLGVDPTPILGGQYATLPLFKNQVAGAG